MLKVLSDAFVAADTGQATLLGLLDLTATFDTVDHAILIERLRLTFGVVDSALHWMTSYLRRHPVQCTVNNTKRKTKSLNEDGMVNSVKCSMSVTVVKC